MSCELSCAMHGAGGRGCGSCCGCDMPRALSGNWGKLKALRMERIHLWEGCVCPPVSPTQLMRSTADRRTGPHGLSFKAKPTGPPLPFTSAYRSSSCGIQMRSPPPITDTLSSGDISLCSNGFSDKAFGKYNHKVRKEEIVKWCWETEMKRPISGLLFFTIQRAQYCRSKSCYLCPE